MEETAQGQSTNDGAGLEKGDWRLPASNKPHGCFRRECFWSRAEGCGRTYPAHFVENLETQDADTSEWRRGCPRDKRGSRTWFRTVLDGVLGGSQGQESAGANLRRITSDGVRSEEKRGIHAYTPEKHYSYEKAKPLSKPYAIAYVSDLATTMRPKRSWGEPCAETSKVHRGTPVNALGQTEPLSHEI